MDDFITEMSVDTGSSDPDDHQDTHNGMRESEADDVRDGQI